MAKADRLARLDDRRLEAEAEYRSALIDALRVTAAGKWGLFDHNPDRAARAAAAPTVEALTAIAHDIEAMRTQLGLPAFDLHRQFLGARGPVAPQAVGEPKQAQAWLDRLAASEGATRN
jgi:hypothetical protein